MGTHMHTRVCTHAHPHMYTYACACAHMYARTQCIHTCTPPHVHTHMRAHTHAPVTGAFVWGSLGRGKLSLGASLQPLWTEAVGWGSLAQGWWGGSSSPAFVLSLRCGCSPQSTGPGAGSPSGHNGVCVPPEGQRAGHAEAGAVSGNPGLDSC